MRLTLSPAFRLNHLVSFAALFLFILLVPPFAALIAGSIAFSAKAGGMRLLGSLFSGLAGAVLCDLGLWLCLRRRQFMLAFGRWQEGGDPESPEKRALAGGAREAFMEGDFAKSARMLQRYLEGRPADNAERLNLASCLVLLGRPEEAMALIEVAGDPRGQLRYLAPAQGPAKWFSPARPFSRAQALQAAARPLVLRLALLFGAASALLVHEESKISAWLLARDSSGLQEADFKRAESANIILLYHDEALAGVVRSIADEALLSDLKFFNLPENQFQSHKIKVFLCDSQQEYLKRSPFASSWEAGAAVPDKNTFYIYVKNRKIDPFFYETVAHELCHICYYQINSGLSQDSWLNEGLARFQGFNYLCFKYNLPGAAWIKENVFRDIAKAPLPFELFLHHRPQELENVEQVSQFYNQGHSMVYVLIQYYGKDSFLKFLHNFSRSQDMNASFAGAYDSIHSLDDLQAIWSLFFK
jgi:hypothetical protein